MDPMELRPSANSDPAHAQRTGSLRAVTWLAPGIPLRFFEILCAYLSRSLSRPIELESRERSSGPMHGESDPFAEGQVDIGFLCSPSYLYLASKPHPSVELIPAGFAFDRNAPEPAPEPAPAPEPTYYSDVIVRKDHTARRFEDLAGGVWGFNDECSLSGYFSALQQLEEDGNDAGYFREQVRTGSHFSSIQAVLRGDIDAAAIDSTVLSLYLRDHPQLRWRLRTLTSWGPFPIQPIVVRRDLVPALSTRLAAALLQAHEHPETATRLARYRLLRCVPISEQLYTEERRALCSLSPQTLLQPTAPWHNSPSPLSTSTGCSVNSAVSAPRP